VTLLPRPVSVPILVTMVKAALRARRRQYDLRDVLARLEDDVQQRDRFLAMLGHELRNPLGAIRNALYLLDLSGPAGGPTAVEQRNLDVIRRQAALLSRLVDDLLEVSRVTAGKIALQREPVDLKDLALRCVQAADGAARAAGVTLQLEAGSDPMIVTGDAARLEQVVMNLIANAIKYTPAGGSVEVELRRRGSHAFLEVRDTGIGLSPDVLPRVFDLFMQAEHSLARAQGGLGIGLTLVRTLVERHGGTVAAASEGTGQGSTFTVRLPLARATVTLAPPQPPRPVPPLHILVVEDSADNRESLVLLLRQLGHRVDAAEDGQTGLDRLAELRPQVALIDIGLPRLDGYGVAQRARERTGWQTFLIALTGYGQPEDQRRAYQSGFDAHLTKPLRLESLNEILTRVSKAAGVGC
jgi:CheY-like chemotaxis protein